MRTLSSPRACRSAAIGRRKYRWTFDAFGASVKAIGEDGRRDEPEARILMVAFTGLCHPGRILPVR
jgi:hypothetical protein